MPVVFHFIGALMSRVAAANVKWAIKVAGPPSLGPTELLPHFPHCGYRALSAAENALVAASDNEEFVRCRVDFLNDKRPCGPLVDRPRHAVRAQVSFDVLTKTVASLLRKAQVRPLERRGDRHARKYARERRTS